MLRSFPGIVKTLLKKLPTNDYPVLNSRLFVQIWLNLILDKSLTSLRDLFFRLNNSGIPVDISTFSKACKQRGYQVFNHLFVELLTALRQKRSRRSREQKLLYAIDSTIITLTSKLFWAEQYHQVKLLTGLDLETGSIGEPLLHFGQNHDEKFADMVMTTVPENGIAVEDRGFCGLSNLQTFKDSEVQFIVRIKNNYKLEFLEGKEELKIGSKETVNCRVVSFCDCETKVEYRLATNVPTAVMTDAEIGESYRSRWQIELLWKFLKMHLKLDKLMTKSVNGVRLQIYAILIVYLLLQLMEIPQIYGASLLNKLRFIHLHLAGESNFVSWSDRILP
jgi:putative transposase